jgi:poly(A) polymerase Pap1
MFYLQRSIPDLAQFRIAFLLIKAWAKTRGLYGPKFGLLGGIHITVLLVPVCKALTKASPRASTADIITTFFHHYAEFDWQAQIVLDPFFHKDLKYHRTAREPLCLLGWHPPALNTAVAASVPTVKCIAAELAKTSNMLMKQGMTWDAVIGSSSLSPDVLSNTGVYEFLHSYKSYVQVDTRYWGSSPSYGRKFLGWVESRCVAILVGK